MGKDTSDFTVKDFDKTWKLLAKMGNVDGYGGNEYRWSKELWIQTGQDNPPDFILINRFKLAERPDLCQFL